MFKNLGDILSGKRARENRAAEYTLTEPTKRFEGSGLASHPTDMNFSKALGMTTSMITGQLLFDSNVTCLALQAKSCEPEPLRRLAAFVAWWLVSRYQEDAQSVVQGETDSEAALSDWIAVTTRVTELMYPLDAVARNAVAAYQDGERRTIEGSFAQPSLEAIRICAGLEAVDLNRDSMTDFLAISSHLIAHRDSLAQVFGVLQGNA